MLASSKCRVNAASKKSKPTYQIRDCGTRTQTSAGVEISAVPRRKQRQGQSSKKCRKRLVGSKVSKYGNTVLLLQQGSLIKGGSDGSDGSDGDEATKYEVAFEFQNCAVWGSSTQVRV
jgi:hypothetical protein